MDKFYNLATGKVEEVNPSKITAALGLEPWRDEDANPIEAIPGQVKPTHQVIDGEKYSFFTNNAEKYDANSASDYVEALKSGALPWDPILQEGFQYKQELRSGNFFTSAEKAKGYASKVLSGKFLGLPELGYSAYAAAQLAKGDTADARATLLKKAILDEELGVGGAIADTVGVIGSVPAKFANKLVAKQLDKFANTAFAKSIEGKLVSKVATNIATRGAAGAVESGIVTGAQETAQAFIPQTEEEFEDPSTIAEHIIARLGDVPSQTAESMKYGAIGGATIQGIAEAPRLGIAAIKAPVAPLWRAFAGTINAKGENIGQFADALGANQYIPKGTPAADALERQLGTKQFQKDVDYLREVWDKDIVKKVNQTAQDTMVVLKDSLDVAHKKMNDYVAEVTKKTGLIFDLDDVLAKAKKELETEVPTGAWTEKEKTIFNTIGRIVNKEMKSGYSDDVVEGAGFSMVTPQPKTTLEKLKFLKQKVDDKAAYEKSDLEASYEQLAYRKISRAMEAHTLEVLDKAGEVLKDDSISSKLYKDFKTAQGALKMASETAASKKNSQWGIAPLALSGAVTALLVQGMLGSGITSPEVLLSGMLGSHLLNAYGRNIASKSIKFIHNTFVDGENAIASSAQKFAKLTPQAVKDRGETALRLLTSRELATMFNAPEPTNNGKERYMIGVNSALGEWASNTEAVAETVSSITSGISETAPNTTAEIQKNMTAAIQWLQTQVPKPNDMSALGLSEYHVSDAQVDEFNQKATAVFAPSLVVQNIQNGTATAAQLQGLKIAYPSIYNSIQSSFATETAQNPRVNTLTKTSLGLVLDKPVTTPMRKRYLDLLQQNYIKQDGPGRPKSTSSMQSLGSMFQTEANRVANRNSAP